MLEVVLPIVGAVLVTVGFVAWLLRSMSRGEKDAQSLVQQLTPHAVLVDAVVAPGEEVALRTRATVGAVKLWLEMEGALPADWIGVAHVTYVAHPADGGYRETTEPTPPAHARVSFYDGSDGITSDTTAKRTGAIGIPKGTAHWVQLVAFPSVPEGTELVATVRLEPPGAAGVRFRAFVGVSGR